MLFHVRRDLPGQYLWMILTVFGFAAGNSATHVYASELFPTEIRATGYGWTTNLAGRVTEVAIPTVIGLMIASAGDSRRDRGRGGRADPRRPDRAALRARDEGAHARADRRAPAPDLSGADRDFALLYLPAAGAKRRLPSLPERGGRRMDQTRVRKLLKEIGLAAALAAVLIGLAVGGVASTGRWHRDRDPERMRKHAEFAVEFALREVDATPEQVARVKAIVAGAIAGLDQVHDQHAANRDDADRRALAARDLARRRAGDPRAGARARRHGFGAARRRARGRGRGAHSRAARRPDRARARVPRARALESGGAWPTESS